MQGYSSQITNFQVEYDDTALGTQATLLHNIASRRIESSGFLDATDKFEQPFYQLDFILNQNSNDWLSRQVRMKNLLNDKVVIKQRDEITRQFKRGRQFNLGVSISF